MLTGKQRSYLKKLGQELDPVVYIGKSDLTENVIREMDTLLESRELIKVKLQEGCILDPKQTANETAEMLGAEFVQAIGRRFVLYRQAPEKENRKIVLPR
jgi:RNA-binding protein